MTGQHGLPARACESCNAKLERRRTESGRQESIARFADRRFCSQKCFRRSSADRADAWTGGVVKPEDAARFWSRIKIQEPDDCWPWTKAVNNDGYGRLAVIRGGKRKWLFAHRLAHRLATGDSIDGLTILHSCDNPPCCNPAHLRLGTQLDNIADAFAKQRMIPPPKLCGSAQPAAVLNESDVVEIRVWIGLGFSQTSIANAYGVSAGVIGQIRKGKAWAHVPLAVPQ